MTIFTLDELRNPISLSEAITELKGILEDQGIDTTNWLDGSPSQTNLQLCAYIYSQLDQKIASSVNSSMNQFSSGSGLTALSDSYFDNQRIQAQKTVGQMIVSASANILPRTWTTNELKVTDGTFVFSNDEQIALTAVNNLYTGSFSAEESGVDYNIATDSTLTPVQTEVGLSITNPAVISTTTWITTTGNDEEDDETLRQRNALKWSSLEASEFTTDRVKALALSASSDIHYVSIDDQNPRGQFTVDVYVAYETAAASAADVALVQQKLNNSFFGNATYGLVTAYNATQVTFSSLIDVYYNPTANLSNVKTAVESACNAFIADIPIGGKTYLPFSSLSNVARINDLIAAIEAVNGVSTCTINPSTDLSFAANEKLSVPTSWDSLITYNKLSVTI